jgi:recombination protein RecT
MTDTQTAEPETPDPATDEQPATAVALPSETNPKPATIASFIQAMTPELARALPRGLDADRMARLALTVVRKTPKLAECTQASFAGALMTSAALGLEPGVNGEAHLVPYKNRGTLECQLIIGYPGFVKLFYQHPLAEHIDAQAVYERDEFDFEYGSNRFLRHRPAVGDRGDIVAYYAIATLTSGGSHFVVLTPQQVKDLRRGKEGSNGDIPDPERWMERKTALRQLVKMLPKSAVLTHAFEADEQPGSSRRARQVAEDVIDVNPETGEVLEP